MKLLTNDQNFKSFLRKQDMWKVIGIGSQWVSIEQMRNTISNTNYICEFIIANCDLKGHRIQPDAQPSVLKYQLSNYLKDLDGLQLFYLYEALMDIDAVINDLLNLNVVDRLEFLANVTGKGQWYLQVLDEEICGN
ncbi:MAG: hypothetical protein FJX99_08770 [Bacteroidetes bacterium]|nr:hypothetical protein [Bacteroidota bacterium]